LRGGRVTGVCVPAQESNASLSRLMIGTEPPALARRVQEAGAVVLEVRGLSLPRADQYGVDLQRIHLQVRAGEVLGIAGVSGNGQQELLRALSGEDRRAPVATVRIDGVDVSMAGPVDRRVLGLHFVPEERLGRGAVPPMSLADNLLLTRDEAVQSQRWMGGWIDTVFLRRQANSIIDRFHVKAHGSSAPARSLSGGNLQKFIVGREIDAKPRCFIVSQPTWGVDVGASAQIRAAILAMRDAGCAVLLLSEELDELFQMADRLQVMAQGALSPSLPIADATVDQVGQWMSGLWSTA
jgi:simple sugar transport system ATP-binding protein